MKKQHKIIIDELKFQHDEHFKKSIDEKKKLFAMLDKMEKKAAKKK